MSGLGGFDDAALRGAFGSIAETAARGERCPAPEALWDSTAGGLDRRERTGVFLHLGECSTCATAWRLARELRAGEPPARVVRGPAPWFRAHRVHLAAAAAMLVIAVGIAVLWRQPGRGPAAEFRAKEMDWIRPAIPAGEPLARERCLLRWTPGPEGTTYDVRVTTEDLDPVARGRGLERAEFQVPAASLAGMAAGDRIVWQVTAHLPDGGTADSRSFISEVR